MRPSIVSKSSRAPSRASQLAYPLPEPIAPRVTAAHALAARDAAEHARVTHLRRAADAHLSLDTPG